MDELASDGLRMWELFTHLYPVFREAVGRVDRVRSGSSLTAENTRNTIHFCMENINAILSEPDWCEELQDAAITSEIASPLSALLREFHDAMTSHTLDVIPSNEEAQGSSIRQQFPNLARIEHDLLTAGRDDQTQLIQDFASELNLDQRLFPIAERLSDFVSGADAVRHEEAEFTKRIVNYDLSIDDIDFIEEAQRFDKYSQKLYEAVAKSVSCNARHRARLCLRGIIDPVQPIQLHISDCTGYSVNLTEYEWAKTPESPQYVTQRVCKDQSTHSSMKFDGIGLWGCRIESDKTPGLSPTITIEDFLAHYFGKGNANRAYLLKPDQRKVAEVVLACLLLHMGSTKWVQSSMNKECISAHTPGSGDPHQLHLDSDLPVEGNDHVRDDQTHTVFSFGLLLMEIEAEEAVDWDVGEDDWDQPGSRDPFITLRRALAQWDSVVEAKQKEIARSCLHFPDLCHRLQHKYVRPETKAKAALYYHILRPLRDLALYSFPQCAPLLSKIPRSPDLGEDSAFVSNQQSLASGFRLFDGKEQNFSARKKENAKIFIDELKKVTLCVANCSEKYKGKFEASWRENRIRIAILDTGYATGDRFAELAEDRIKERRNFTNQSSGSEDCQDDDGHGTHVTRLVLAYARSADVYLAKISSPGHSDRDIGGRIVDAIQWATDRDVNIISLSFGFQTIDPGIAAAIRKATKKGATVFAAAANHGGNSGRAFPASMDGDGIICIHASDGKGNDGGISPSAIEKDDNFTTLGIAIPSVWQEKDIHIGGTSFAAPIAAVLVANVLEFARVQCALPEDQYETLCSSVGIRRILRRMALKGSEPRDGYRYVSPTHLWGNGGVDVDKVKDKIREVAAVP